MSGERPYVASDPKQVEDAKRDARTRRRGEIDDLRWLMGDARGRRFVHRLLETAGVFRTSFAGRDAETFFREGARNVGLQVLADVMDATPDDYLGMLKEARKDG